MQRTARLIRNAMLTYLCLSFARAGTIDFEEFLQMMTAKMGERDSREEIQKAFKLFDDDNTGFITLKNLKRVAKELVSICMATLRNMQPCYG